MDRYVSRDLSEPTNLFLLAVANWNDLWAHIEACASIVTACLPTLKPLFSEGRTPESLIGSAKGIFMLKSGSLFSIIRNKSTLEERPSADSEDARKAWEELTSVKHNVTINTNRNDLETYGK